MTNLMPAFKWLSTELDRLTTAHLQRRARSVTPLADGWCEVEGRRLTNFATNDYLGLASDPRVISAARAALIDAGAGARASALVIGRTSWHEGLEQQLAAFEGTAAALLFPTGYAANVGTITALVGPGDLVLCDRLNHASLIDGCRLSRARFRVYPHGDVDFAERELRRGTETRRKLIVTDSLFSMDGDAAPLRDLCDLAKQQGAMLLVDEAHATGVCGAHGRGLTEELGIEGRELIKVGTLSKALGSQGGFVAGSRQLIDWLFNTARTQMFSTALTPAACAAACAALEIVAQEPQRRERLRLESTRLKDRLLAARLNVPSGTIGPILPIVIGDAARTVAVGEALQAGGHLVGTIRPPTVPQRSSRLRISLSAAHRREDLDALAEQLIALCPAVPA